MFFSCTEKPALLNSIIAKMIKQLVSLINFLLFCPFFLYLYSLFMQSKISAICGAISYWNVMKQKWTVIFNIWLRKKIGFLHFHWLMQEPQLQKKSITARNQLSEIRKMKIYHILLGSFMRLQSLNHSFCSKYTTWNLPNLLLYPLTNTKMAYWEYGSNIMHSEMWQLDRGDYSANLF
jgi:hypothetical protein